MTNTETNAPGAGHNEAPDYAQTITAALDRDYEELVIGAQGLLAEAATLPKEIPDGDESTLNNFTTLIKRMRDTTARIISYHTSEKEPHLRAGQAVDQFFFRLHEKLARRNTKDKPGASDILQARVGDFLRRKEAAERAERERLAKIEADRLRKLREEQEAAEQAAREAELRASRARKDETEARANAEKARQDQIAAERAVQAAQQAQQADDARIDALAKPADLARTRTTGGAVATLKQEPFVAIDDVTLLNKDMLWPFLKDEHILMALKAWAKTKSHKTPMPGATIEMRNVGVVR